MPLVIEDGSGVANANSYGNLADARSYAADRGVTLSTDDPTLTAQLILACDFLESFADRYVGSPVSFTQSLSWPRQGVMYDCDTAFPSNEIPPQLISAQYQLCIEQFNGIDLQPTTDYSQGGYVTEEKTDVLITKYSEKIGTTQAPLMPKVMALLKTLLNSTGGTLRTVRV